MNISYEWLKELVPVTLSPVEVGDLLTAHCASVDDVTPLRADLDGIVIARVVSAGRHPNSDHLWVTKVDAGGPELLDVVCGAPNVTQGALYPFAPVGTVLPGGLRLEKRKIRGELSNGMLCSARELGLGEDHAGIMELAVDVLPGARFLDALAIGDSRIVLDVTPNRPDLLSHIGVARELSAATGVALVRPADSLDSWSVPRRVAREGMTASTTVRVADDEGCTRYVGAVIMGVTIGESPDWLKRRLEAVGLRSLNNVVDVTNLVLHESGQPLHAFDVDRLNGGAVVVRRAGDGETLITLDGATRTLNPSMTVIADASAAHAVAGVMGGMHSAVTTDTRNIFLEIATFDARRIRATRLALGMSSDASYRFERGVDPDLPGTVVKRAVKLILELAGGQLADVPVDVYPVPSTAKTLILRAPRVAVVLGEKLSAAEIGSLLKSVGFSVVNAAEQGELAVLVPTWRVDVESEIDLVEEVARLRGYASFPDDVRAYRPGTVPSDRVHQLSRVLRSRLCGLGLFEVRPLPFVRGAEASHIRVANPISEEEGYLRRSVLETLASRVEYNLTQMQGNVRLFEIGNVFAPLQGGGGMPSEAIHVGAVLLGDRFPVHFSAPKPPQFDEWDAKGLAETIAELVYPNSSRELEPDATGDGSLWSIHADGHVVGSVRRMTIDAPLWAATAYGVELRIVGIDSGAAAPKGKHNYSRSTEHDGADASDTIGTQGARRATVRYKPIPTQPSADFDLALVVPDTVSAAEVEALLRRTAGELMESLDLFDEFRGKGLPPGSRSLAWRLTFRHHERTLRDKEVEARRQKLLTALEKDLGVRQRSS